VHEFQNSKWPVCPVSFAERLTRYLSDEDGERIGYVMGLTLLTLACAAKINKDKKLIRKNRRPSKLTMQTRVRLSKRVM